MEAFNERMRTLHQEKQGENEIRCLVVPALIGTIVLGGILAAKLICGIFKKGR